MQKEVLFDYLAQNEVTCGFAFNQITNENKDWRLNEQAASAGFIYRHVGEIMNLFGHFFGVPPQVQNTTMGKMDEGQGGNVEESRQLVAQGYAMLQSLIENTPDEDWQAPVETPFFGVVSKARLFAHVLYHNAYHAGQIGLTVKKGK